MKILNYVWMYLKDWRNLLSHTLIGVLILAVAFFIPVKPIYRIILLVVIVAFNVTRMNLAKKKKKADASATEV
ncbi:MAG: hypothetical protein WCR42_08915 [bacterium]